MKILKPAMSDFDIQTMLIRNAIELHQAREAMGAKYNGHPARHVRRRMVTFEMPSAMGKTENMLQAFCRDSLGVPFIELEMPKSIPKPKAWWFGG